MVPNNAERSGQIVAQVDYMPIGHGEKGWNGEVGTYVFSSKYSKLVKTYPVKTAAANDAASSLEQYCVNVLPFLGEKVECVQTDAGTQFTSKEWAHTCAKYMLQHRTCPIDHQAMNGQVERVQGILVAKTRALLMDSGMNNKFWPLALETATYLLNRTPHESLEGLSPLEKSTGQRPDLSRTRVFGCTAYVQVPKASSKERKTVQHSLDRSTGRLFNAIPRMDDS